MSRIVALIPAAGYSSRMGFFKPLQTVHTSLLIEKPIDVLRCGGIDDIRIIVGYKKELLYPVLSRWGVSIIENLNYDQGMFSSIQCGVRTLEEDVEAFFLLPADYPCIKVETIKQLVTAFEQRAGEVIYPCFEGKRGHPPLISMKYCLPILNSQKQDNLGTVLKNNVGIYQEIDVNDSGIIHDLDKGSDYGLLVGIDKMQVFPVQEECFALLRQAEVNENIILHAKTVTDVAVKIAETLNSAGCHLNLGLVLAGSLLHDIAKGQNDHALKGKEMVNRLGYPGVADIVGSHMDISIRQDKQLDEAAIVYLADKLVQGSRTVSLEERFSQALINNVMQDIREKVGKRMTNAELIRTKVEDVTKMSLGYLLDYL